VVNTLVHVGAILIEHLEGACLETALGLVVGGNVSIRFTDVVNVVHSRLAMPELLGSLNSRIMSMLTNCLI